jgi:hypothetical protein
VLTAEVARTSRIPTPRRLIGTVVNPDCGSEVEPDSVLVKIAFQPTGIERGYGAIREDFHDHDHA